MLLTKANLAVNRRLLVLLTQGYFLLLSEGCFTCNRMVFVLQTKGLRTANRRTHLLLTEGCLYYYRMVSLLLTEGLFYSQPKTSTS